MKKLCAWMVAILAICSMSAFAGLTIEWDPQSGKVVKGFDATTLQKAAVYVTSEGESITSLNLKIALPAGVTMADGVTSGATSSVIWNKSLFYLTPAGEIDEVETITKKSVSNGSLTISLSLGLRAGVTECLKLQSGVRAKLCDVEFKVDVDAVADDVDVLTLDSAVTKCQASKRDLAYNADMLKLSFSLLRDTFSFATKDGVTVEMDETDDGSKFAIAATDEDLFTAEIWDVAQGKMVSTDAVEFVAVEAIDAVAGMVAIEDGKLVYAPKKDYFGEFTVTYTAKSTEAGTEVIDTLDFVVHPVNDAPVIAFADADLRFDEGATLKFAVTFEDVDTEWDAFAKTVTLNGVAVAGNWEGFAFTADEAFAYDVVAHPEKELALALAVALDDGAGDDGSKANIAQNIVIADVDQATDFGASAVTIVADADPAVYGSKLTATFVNQITDADGDVAVIEYQWYRNDAAVAGENGAVLQAAVKKGDVWTCQVIATVKPYGADDQNPIVEEFASNEIAIGNTAPATADAELFIRKVADADATDSVEIAMSDVDNDELTIVIKRQGTKGTAEVNGNKITYTVTDKTVEFYDADADQVVFVVNDGTDDSAEATLAVTYRENPPAEVVVTADAPEAIDEVDENGEAVSFTVAIEATDSALVQPSGIKSIEWVADGLDIQAGAIEGIDTDHATATATVTTKGYATLDGADRPASKEFTVKAIVTDALNAKTTVTMNVVVNDVDRKAPATFAIAFAPATVKTEDDLTAAINGEVEDPDGDTIIGYKFAWTVNGADVAGNDAVLAANNFKKGDTVAVIACALTKPYDAEEVENDWLAEAATIDVANTVPALAKKDDAKVEATEDTVATISMADLVNAVDPDVADGVDTLTYDVQANFGAEVGTITFDAATGDVVFTPAQDYNTADAAELPTIAVTVTDGEATTDAVEIEISVAAVNDAPVAEVRDIYIQPNQIGDIITVTFKASVGPENESAQKLVRESLAVAYTAPEDGKALIDGEIAGDIDDVANEINFTFKVAEDAVIGATGSVEFTFADNGDENATSAAYSFKIILSGTPWYPTVALPCEHDEEGLLVRINENGELTDIIVKERNAEGKFELTAAMYYNSGFKGFDRNAVANMTIYHWSAKDGTGDECAEIEDGITVPDYQAPGKAALTGDAANPSQIEVSAPLASRFYLEIYEMINGAQSANPVAIVNQEFVPNGYQMETSAKVTVAGLERGKVYTAKARGFNPMGESGEWSDDLVIDMTQSAPQAWPGDGEFFPVQNWVQTVATNVTNVTFKWPVNAKADSYQLKLFDGNGTAIGNIASTNVNSQTLALQAGSYRWYVVSSTGEQSDMMLFTITKDAGNSPVIMGGIGEGNTLILNAENVTAGALYMYDVIYFDANYNMWAYQLFAGRATADGQLELTGDDVELFQTANYIMIRPTAVGSYQTLLINDR